MTTKLDLMAEIAKLNIEISGCDRRIRNLEELHSRMQSAVSLSRLQSARADRSTLIVYRNKLQKELGPQQLK